MPHTAVLPRARLRTSRRLPGRRVLGELSLGLLVGGVAGWLAGLLRVRRP